MVLAGVAPLLERGYEIVVVDDGSTDGTARVAESTPGVRLERHASNRGKGAAMATGAAGAAADRLVFVDADATYPPDAIPTLVDMLDAYDVVRGERPLDSEHIPAVNRLGNRMFNRLLGAFHGLEGSDFLSGMYAMRRSAFEELRLESAGFDIEVEIGVKARQRGLTVGTVPIEYHPRLGEKKLRPVRDGLRILSRTAGMAILFSPTLTFVLPGLALMALGLVGAFALAGGPVFVGSVGLSINSFVLAVLGVLAGFQLVVLGVAAMLYRIETGVPPRRWLLALARRPVRLGAAVTGMLVSVGAGVWLVWLVVSWIAGGAGDFLRTDELVTAAALLVLGLQVLSAGLFLSIFSGRLAARRA